MADRESGGSAFVLPVALVVARPAAVTAARDRDRKNERLCPRPLDTLRIYAHHEIRLRSVVAERIGP
jgi:hypothetical protein